jgi:hypothetical protein
MQGDGKYGKYVRNGRDGKNISKSDNNFPDAERIIPPRGDYQTLLSYQ